MQHADEIGSAQPGAGEQCSHGLFYGQKAQIHALETDIARLSGALAERDARIERLKEDRVALVGAAASLNEDVRQLQSEVYRCEGEIEDLKRKLTIAESKAGAP